MQTVRILKYNLTLVTGPILQTLITTLLNSHVQQLCGHNMYVNDTA